MRVSAANIQALQPGEIFVFGSNLQGQHYGGAARVAHDKFDAQWDVGNGLTGRSYALPTCGHAGVRLPIQEIAKYVDEFIFFAETHPELTFLVTEVGCGIAGHQVEYIAPLFELALYMSNVYLPQRFVYCLTTKAKVEE
jgi:hypothetical protein